jgi:hypothetical protein
VFFDVHALFDGYSHSPANQAGRPEGQYPIAPPPKSGTLGFGQKLFPIFQEEDVRKMGAER